VTKQFLSWGLDGCVFLIISAAASYAQIAIGRQPRGLHFFTVFTVWSDMRSRQQ
jgi:hypothetical protein